MTYLNGLRLGGELPLQIGNLVGRGLLQLLQGVLEVLHILQQPQDLPILGGQGRLKPWARAQREVHLILGTGQGFEGLQGRPPRPQTPVLNAPEWLSPSDRLVAFLFWPLSLSETGPSSLDAFPSILDTKQVGGKVSREGFLEEDVS